MSTYQVEMDEATYRMFAECGMKLNEPNAAKCVKEAVIALAQKINRHVADDANKEFAKHASEWQLLPSGFDGSELVLVAPEGQTSDEVPALSAAMVHFFDQTCILTCWKPTKEQLEVISETGRVWVLTLGEHTPPISLMARNPLEFEGSRLL